MVDDSVAFLMLLKTELGNMLFCTYFETYHGGVKAGTDSVACLVLEHLIGSIRLPSLKT
jgi:hypothetical protein